MRPLLPVLSIFLILSLTVSILPLLIATPGHVMAQQSEPEFSTFINTHFSVSYPSDWVIMETLPNTVRFHSPSGLGSLGSVVINWAFHAPNWILDRNAWLTNMTKQGIVVNRIDNETNISNHTALLISFTDNSAKYSVALVKSNDTLFIPHT
jgi:hypothetical protein